MVQSIALHHLFVFGEWELPSAPSYRSPYLPTGKEVQKPCGFLRIFGDFLCEQKVARRRQGQADSTARPGQCGHRPLQRVEAAFRSDAAGHAGPALQGSRAAGHARNPLIFLKFHLFTNNSNRRY